MATSGTPVSAALIGLPSDDAWVPALMQPHLAKLLGDVYGQMADAGFQYEFYGVSPEGGLPALGSKLQAQRPDAVIIGNGIRSNMELTHFMEQVIDIVHRSVPQAKLLFNTVPDNTVDAVKRWFPTAAKSE